MRGVLLSVGALEKEACRTRAPLFVLGWLKTPPCLCVFLTGSWMGSLWSSARWTQTPPLVRAYQLALVITENISVHPIEQTICSSEMNCWYVLWCQRQKNARNLTCPALFIRRTCSCEALSQSVNYTYSTHMVYFRVFSPHFSFIEKANWVTVLSSEMYNLKKPHINIWETHLTGPCRKFWKDRGSDSENKTEGGQNPRINQIFQKKRVCCHSLQRYLSFVPHTYV